MKALALALPVLCGACLAPRPPWLGEDYALVSGGTILLEAGGERVEALLVEDGLVLAAGGQAEIEERAHELVERARGFHIELGVRRIDLAGGFAVPGLQDAHGHIEGLGELLESVDLTDAASFEEVVERVRARAAEVAAGEWIVGRGWDQTRWGTEFPHHAALSAATPRHPVFLERVDGHAALVNARVLELAGLSLGPLPEVEGGRVVADASGAPTGVFVDAAMGLVALMPPPDLATHQRRILAAQEALLAAGLTCVHDMGLSEGSAYALAELERQGRLALRVIGYLWANQGLGASLRHPRRSDEDPASKLRILGAKLMIDGALGSRGAALLAPYSDAGDQAGLLQMTPEAFGERLREVVAAGLQPATHAIGDRGNRVVLDAYEAELRRDPRFAELRARIEHAQVVAPEDWPRFAQLGVIPSMQPTHATSDMRWAEARVGPERIAGAYAWKRLAGANVPLACGSDFPVESPRPLLGLYAARTRMDAGESPPGGWLPDQALDGAEALAGFTTGAAFAAREEGRRGKLRPGYAADLTVLDVDPEACAPRALLSARVLLTVVDGVIVHPPFTCPAE